MFINVETRDMRPAISPRALLFGLGLAFILVWKQTYSFPDRVFAFSNCTRIGKSTLLTGFGDDEIEQFG